MILAQVEQLQKFKTQGGVGGGSTYEQYKINPAMVMFNPEQSNRTMTQMKERQSAKGTGTPINSTSAKNKAKASTPDKFKSKPQTIKIDANLAEQL